MSVIKGNGDQIPDIMGTLSNPDTVVVSIKGPNSQRNHLIGSILTETLVEKGFSDTTYLARVSNSLVKNIPEDRIASSSSIADLMEEAFPQLYTAPVLMISNPDITVKLKPYVNPSAYESTDFCIQDEAVSKATLLEDAPKKLPDPPQPQDRETMVREKLIEDFAQFIRNPNTSISHF